MKDDYTSKSPSAGRIGAAVEHLVAAACILASDAELNVSTSLVDDEGVDLVFHRRGQSTTLAVQVKARSTDTSVLRRGQFTAFVREATFRPRADLFMLFVVVDRASARLTRCWFVPSTQFDRLAGATNRGTRRFVASNKEATADQWSQWRLPFEQLPSIIIEALEQLEAGRA
ncbi:MAG: hypothetical protein AB7F65_02925 [Dehalococcoidia bacterium]